MCSLALNSCWQLTIGTRPTSTAYGYIFTLFLRQFGDNCHGLNVSSCCHRSSVSNKYLSKNKLLSIRSKVQQDYGEKLEKVNCREFATSFASQHNQGRMVVVPKVKLNNSLEMPILGLGTYMSCGNEGELAVKHAIDCGYRHFDTAYFYQNEEQVGKAINDKIGEGVITREDVFVVTKLWNIYHAKEKVEYACRMSLKKLSLDYIDLYLMHLPVGYAYIDDNTLLPKDDQGKLITSDIDYLETYKAMENLVKLGLVKSIGVSNFNSEQIERILQDCEIKPVTNQVECHPALNQKKLIQFCKDRNIKLTAYCPLGRPNPEEKKPEYLYSNKTKTIAAKYNKTPAQVVLRYLIEIGTIPIPKSSNKQRIEENINIFDFKLTDDEICVLDSFNTGERLVPFPLIKGRNHKFYPFNIEY